MCTVDSLTCHSVPQHGSHPTVILSRVKAMDKKESLSAYKRVKTWSLLDLKLVDCHSDGPELDFKFEKQIFKWIVLNMAEKKSFIVHLFKVSRGGGGLCHNKGTRSNSTLCV